MSVPPIDSTTSAGSPPPAISFITSIDHTGLPALRQQLAQLDQFQDFFTEVSEGDEAARVLLLGSECFRSLQDWLGEAQQIKVSFLVQKFCLLIVGS